MNNKEIAEIRRRLRYEKNNIGRIRGCYVNDKHAIISKFDQMLGLISNDEAEEILSMLRRTLSGALGRNLIDITFTTQQVSDSEEHRLLMSLRDSSLADDAAVNNFFEKTVSSLDLDGSYFILLANDKYDVFTYNANGEKENSTQTFSYVICAICPIKTVKPSLGYNVSENKFKNIIRDSVIGTTEIGFMFPAFNSRSTDIYNALFYTRDVSASYDSFTDSIFKCTMPMPAAEQAASIANILHDTVNNSCDLELVQAVQSQLIEITNDHKSNKEESPLILSAKDMGSLLRCSGVGEDAISAFSQKIEEDFGTAAAVTPSNFFDIKKFEVRRTQN